MTENVMAKNEIDIYTTTQASGDPGNDIDGPGTAAKRKYKMTITTNTRKPT